MKLTLLLLFLLLSSAVFGQHLFDYNLKNSISNPTDTIQQLKKSNSRTKNKAKNLFFIGLCYENLNQEDSAFVYYLKAKKEFSKLNSGFSKEICLNIHQVISSQKNYDNYGTQFLDEFNEYAFNKKNSFLISLALNEYAKLKIGEFNSEETNPEVLVEADNFLKKSLVYATSSKNEILIGKVYSNFGVLKRAQGKIDSSRFYYDKSISLNTKNNQTQELFINYFNYGNTYFGDGNYKEALRYYEIAEKINLPKYKNKTLLILYKKIAKTCDSLDDDKQRRLYQEKYDSLSSFIDVEKQNKTIADLETKYKTKEKELQIVKLENHQIMNYSIIGFLIIVVTTSVLAYKNLSKKKKIIEQEKQLETQKLETTLKEQELHEIDVMLESQEKERQRIANELHDNLGSMLTTLKHNFENLKRSDTAANKEKDLFLKTDLLIEEAYQEVRNIAHLKNLGVIGSEGLVIAVKKMAEKMSVLEKLHINVIPHGLNERLENTIEVMLFRMIQELCTNIIKHSEATEVNIYLTQHNNNELNIIIEDNGIGFDPKNAVSTSGIGLKSIEKKVEQMNGTFTIDSIVSKGTTIIIDLPI